MLLHRTVTIQQGQHSVLNGTLHSLLFPELYRAGQVPVPHGQIGDPQFMPRFTGPYTIKGVDEQHSTVTLDLPNSAHFHPVFHTSQVIPFVENDDELFPSRAKHKPPPVAVDGFEEHFVDRIIAA